MFNESVHETQRLELSSFAGCAFPPLFCPETLSLVLAVVHKKSAHWHQADLAESMVQTAEGREQQRVVGEE